QDVQTIAGRFQRQYGLFPENAGRAELRTHGLRFSVEVGLARNQFGTGVPVGKNEIQIVGIDARKSVQQLTKVDLCPSHAAGKQIKCVDTDTRHELKGAPGARSVSSNRLA